MDEDIVWQLLKDSWWSASKPSAAERIAATQV